VQRIANLTREHIRLRMFAWSLNIGEQPIHGRAASMKGLWQRAAIIILSKLKSMTIPVVS
jgi:hypothetical protein